MSEAWFSMKQQWPEYDKPILVAINGIPQPVTYVFIEGEDVDWFQPYHFGPDTKYKSVFPNGITDWAYIPILKHE